MKAEADLGWLETVETAKVASTRPCVFGAFIMMKKLLLLALFAVPSEAMAQDAQFVPERAAMVEIIRAYARSSASLLGPEGISERVLEAVGQTERHRFIPGGSCSVAYMDGPASHWPGPDNIAAVHSRTDDPSYPTTKSNGRGLAI